MKTRAIFVITLLLISSLCFAKRSEPVEVPAIISWNYVYIVPHWASENGTGQNGGYIEVLDAKTGVPVWGVQVYKTKYDSRLEKDVQDVFITEIELDISGTVLMVTDELKRKYEINLKTREVTKIE
jgi:ribosomal protein L24